MKNFAVLAESIDFIERNLREPITRMDIANHCFVSLSLLEKLYRYALHHSIQQYIARRRMTQAAREIATEQSSVTDLAIRYQYGSVEAFSRAFRRVWHVNPSEFKGTWRFTGIFPKINFQLQQGDDLQMARKRVDISEAYDYFKEHKGSYVLCFDAQNFSAFNAVSRKAGDLGILAMAARIEKAADDSMLLLRIGGDEFALVTGLYDGERARELADQVLAQNGEPIFFEGQELPLSLWCGMTIIPESLRYSEFFGDMHHTILQSKG